MHLQLAQFFKWVETVYNARGIETMRKNRQQKV